MRGLHLDHVTLSLGSRPLLSIDRLVGPGEIVTVMGSSGSGKSTLLRHLVGARPPAFSATGSVSLDGRRLDDLPPERRSIGILFQDDLLFPHLSVGGNLLFAMARGGKRAERRQRAEAALGEAGLAGSFDRDPATLSGGQRSRVALLRVLLSEPRALLLDEPFSKLDMALRAQIRTLVFAQTRRRALPTLLVTHDIADAEAAGGATIVLRPHPDP
jgi:putative thiamine transport system ATP-binding protein